MSTRRENVAIVCHLIPVAVLVALGTIYQLRQEFMPYHQAAVATAWSEVPPRLQVLILALMRCWGAASLSTALAMVVVLWGPFRRRRSWTTWLIPAMEVLFFAPALVAAHSVHSLTDDLSRWWLSMALLVPMGVAVFLVPPRRSDGRPREARATSGARLSL